jgi:pyridoxal phosphate enzyme (YggS family)
VNDAQLPQAAEPTKARVTEISENLASVRDEIATAALAAGRLPEDVTLVVVTKTFSASDILALAELGVRDIGESRDQEAKVKFAQLAGSLPEDMRWHFIGQLQTNKARSVAKYADCVHSVDRVSLVDALAKGATDAERELVALVQVDLAAGAHEPNRGGVDRAEALALAQHIEDAQGLVLGGVMGVAPLGEPAAPAFARLTAVSDEICERYPTARVISAGMSDDMVDAIAKGATHVRIGSKVLGFRPPIG